jgi:tRNA 2-thiouridine synthesizing protein E
MRPRADTLTYTVGVALASLPIVFPPVATAKEIAQMTDINKLMADSRTGNPETEDHLLDMEGWDENTGRNLAKQEGIEMNPERWEVIHFLRDYYREHGRARSARVVTEALEQRFRDKGGRKYLYELLPGGPVSQGSRIAGLPLPEYSQDRSFGSSQ